MSLKCFSFFNIILHCSEGSLGIVFGTSDDSVVAFTMSPRGDFIEELDLNVESDDVCTISRAFFDRI